MNNVVILGKIIEVSEIHFDYTNKLKAYFNIFLDDMAGNIFNIVISENVIEISRVDRLYKLINNIDNNTIICVCGYISNSGSNITIYCNELFFCK